MKSGKAILSEYFNEYKLTEDVLQKLQACLLKMFIDIKLMCEENEIKYMMSGGSLLGTVRHQGFIPWDDDIDIMMTRSEYIRFRKCFKEKGFSKYYLAEPVKTKGYYYKMPKIYNLNTKLVSVKEEGYRKFSMVSIDIFIIEYVPDSVLNRKIRAILYNTCFHASSMCLDYLYPSKLIEQKAVDYPEIRKYYGFRKALGFAFSHLGGIRFYLKICDRLANYSRKSSLMAVPSAISYDREILPSSVFLELSKGEFCRYSVQIPKNYDLYLRNLYKDYMVIPPKEKREIHVAYLLKI